jgi:uncharacterized DUF497 family protein
LPEAFSGQQLSPRSDTGKDESNRLKHGVSLALGAEVLMNRFGQIGDERRDYSEERFNASGW